MEIKRDVYLNKLIVTADNVPAHQTDNGIEIVNFIDFLLS